MTEKLAVTIPAEPLDGSVFLDRLNRAWQRIGPVWFMAGATVPLFGSSHTALRWGQLLLDCGEGVVIWSPDSETAAARAAEEVAAVERFAKAPKNGATVVHVAPSSPAAPAGFLGFTRHGHPVGGEPPADVTWTGPVARCTGNSNGCRDCRSDAARLLQPLVKPQEGTRTVTGSASPVEVADAIADVAETDPTEAAAREREENAQAEARPHDKPAQLCANCKRRPPKYPGADDPIGGNFCDPCVDRCHESTEFDHECAICRAPKPPAEPLRAREIERPAGAAGQVPR